MNINQVKHELQNIISGKSSESYDAPIQAITSYFRRSQKISSLAEGKLQNKAEETSKLIILATEKDLFYNKIDQDK